jgi:hypothetical protein
MTGCFVRRQTMFARIRRWYRRRLYRPGRIVSRFLAPDVRRDVEVVDASEIDAGRLTVRTRTWNILYAIRGLSPEPPFGEVRSVAVGDLWSWSGGALGWPGPGGGSLTPNLYMVSKVKGAHAGR